MKWQGTPKVKRKEMEINHRSQQSLENQRVNKNRDRNPHLNRQQKNKNKQNQRSKDQRLKKLMISQMYHR